MPSGDELLAHAQTWVAKKCQEVEDLAELSTYEIETDSKNPDDTHFTWAVEGTDDARPGFGQVVLSIDGEYESTRFDGISTNPHTKLEGRVGSFTELDTVLQTVLDWCVDHFDLG